MVVGNWPINHVDVILHFLTPASTCIGHNEKSPALGKDFYIHGPDTLSDVVSVGTGNGNEQHIVFDVKMFEIPCFFFAP